MSDGQRLSRKHSQRAVMDAILREGAISRVALARQTGLSKQTISDIVLQLQEHRFVRETGRTRGPVGRTAITYELDRQGAHVAAVDLGGTKLSAAISGLDGRLIDEETVPTDPRGGYVVVEQIAALCRAVAGRQGIAGLGLAVVGVPGSPDRSSGRVLLAPNIADFDRIDVAAALKTALGTDIVLENDVNLGAVGENRQGAGRGVDNMAFVALGTGTGSGLIADGLLLRGFSNAAGELAFLPFGADPFDPQSLTMGAFERVAGSFGMAARYAELSGAAIDVPALFAKAEAQDPYAVQTLDDTARILARGIAAIAAIVNPEKVVLGGSIGLRPEIITRVRAALPLCFPYPVIVEAGQLGAKASLIGAAVTGVEALFERMFGP